MTLLLDILNFFETGRGRNTDFVTLKYLVITETFSWRCVFIEGWRRTEAVMASDRLILAPTLALQADKISLKSCHNLILGPGKVPVTLQMWDGTYNLFGALKYVEL